MALTNGVGTQRARNASGANSACTRAGCSPTLNITAKRRKQLKEIAFSRIDQLEKLMDSLDSRCGATRGRATGHAFVCCAPEKGNAWKRRGVGGGFVAPEFWSLQGGAHNKSASTHPSATKAQSLRLLVTPRAPTLDPAHLSWKEPHSSFFVTSNPPPPKLAKSRFLRACCLEL